MALLYRLAFPTLIHWVLPVLATLTLSFPLLWKHMGQHAGVVLTSVYPDPGAKCHTPSPCTPCSLQGCDLGLVQAALQKTQLESSRDRGGQLQSKPQV